MRDTETNEVGHAHIIDDFGYKEATCSSWDVVSGFCTPFTKSGAVVTCEPIEGYSLDVKWQTKNLFNESDWYVNHGFGLLLDGSWLGHPVNETCFINTEKRSGSMYLTATCKTDVNTAPFYLLAYYTDGTLSPSLAFYGTDTTQFATKTITTDANKTVDYIKWTYGGGGEYYLKGVMISFVDNVYEPYAKTATITQCGKNLFKLSGREQWTPSYGATLPALNGNRTIMGMTVNNVLSASAAISNYSETKNGITFTSTGDGHGVGMDIKVKPNTTYAFSLTGSTDGRIGFSYFTADNTYISYKLFTKEIFSGTFTTPENCAYVIVVFRTNSDNSTVSYTDIQIELGAVATAYEPYKTANTFSEGEQIPALSGVNTIWADKGIITVSGKTDFVTQLEQLKSAVLARGANI